MKIDSIRIYAEVLEQGLDFKEYLTKSGISCPIFNVYTKKIIGEITSHDSLVDRIRKSKDVDVLITAISGTEEFPILMIEYSTAVPADDHKMQRSDVYYWGSIYKVPTMKIYPNNKGMNQDFGGGDKIEDLDEMLLAYRVGGCFYPIQWKNIPGYDVLETKQNALSCIKENIEIQAIINQIVKCFQDSTSFESYYASILEQYEKKIKKDLRDKNRKIKEPKDLIVDSTRFKWNGSKLSAKINRFGHAMDPDRGVLFFVNMLVGNENTVAEIQINRSSDFNARGGYKSLFDAAPKESEMGEYVKDLIRKQNNVFTDKNALHILNSVWGLPTNFMTKRSEMEYVIEDNQLYEFLIKHSSMATKSIFFLATELILTDKDRKVICSISWKNNSIKRYKEALLGKNFTPVKVVPLTNAAAKEDIVTFASVELYKKLQYDLLAVSYPGAQGDRCVLTGQGKKVLRTYIDIIAYEETENGITVFLEECKDSIAKSYADADKLNDLICDTEKVDGLKRLCKKVTGKSNISAIQTGIGAKHSIFTKPLKVDYIFMFSVSNDNSDKETTIEYSVAVINTKLVDKFKPLINNEGKLIGELKLDKIYAIK